MTNAGDETNTVVVRRWMPLPRDEVFSAWLDPQRLARFMRPGDVAKTTAEVDARVGGKFRIVMEHGGGGAEHWGEYLTIDAPRLLSFTWTSASTDRIATVVTIEFHERDGGTDVVLTHRGLPARTRDQHEHGWGDIVRAFEATAFRPRDDPSAGTA